MEDILKILTRYPVSTRLSLSGTIVVGRDIAHAKLKEMIDAGKDLPQYIKDHPIYYASPTKTPKGMASGSFGPTTAGRMDSYVDLFQSKGGSMVMIAKGNRSQQVTDACHKYGGFYLGSIGGPAAILAQNNIKNVVCNLWLCKNGSVSLVFFDPHTKTIDRHRVTISNTFQPVAYFVNHRFSMAKISKNAMAKRL